MREFRLIWMWECQEASSSRSVNLNATMVQFRWMWAWCDFEWSEHKNGTAYCIWSVIPYESLISICLVSFSTWQKRPGELEHRLRSENEAMSLHMQLATRGLEWKLVGNVKWHDAFTCEPCLEHVCGMTCAYVWRGPRLCVTWLMYEYDDSISQLLKISRDTSHSHVWHDSCICVKWPALMCDNE